MEDQIRTLLEREERQKALAELQAAAQEQDDIPGFPFLLLRDMASPVQILGGVVIGILLGVFTLLSNFLVVVWLLHLSF